jgi:hypothetical protein
MSSRPLSPALRRPSPVTVRHPYTFQLDANLVERARREVGEPDMIRSIEAALAAALDYQVWIREVAVGKRDVMA